MKIVLNNRDEFFDSEELSFNQLLELKKFTFKLIVTRLNGELIKKEQRDITFIKDGDDVTVLHLVTGG